MSVKSMWSHLRASLEEVLASNDDCDLSRPKFEVNERIDSLEK